MRKYLSIVCIIIFCMFFFTVITSAHSGKTDSNGGHTNSSTGEYHYHHGYSAHQHYDIDGDGDLDCPYTFDDKTENNSSKDKGNNISKDTDRITLGIVFKIIGISLLALLLSSAFLLPFAYHLLDSLISFLTKKLFKTELKDSTRFNITIITIVIIVVTIVTIVVLKNEF